MKSHAAMNRIYRLVWNAAQGIWVAVAENAKGRGKGGSVRSSVTVGGQASGGASSGFFLNSIFRAALGLFGAIALMGAPVYAGPAGGVVTAGGGAIAQSGSATTINQSSQRLAIDWNTFSTAANESIVFVQPNAQAIALNRIIGSSPSELLGSLAANGQVFILNPNGVLFGAGAKVNVGGLVASTLSMSNADFIAGNNVFTASGSNGSVVNRGALTAASGGYIALLAPEVRNEGVISATLGTALLAAGNKVTLNLNNGSLLGYSIDQGAINALADNKQLIQANGGQVILSARAADALSKAVVNNTGVIEAKSLTSVGGKIVLEGDFVSQTGKLDASGTSGGRIAINARGILDAGTVDASGSAGNGGSIAYNASQAIVQTAAAELKANGSAAGGTVNLQAGKNFFSSGKLSATGATGGSITTLASNVTLAAATLDASGTTQGGSIRVGGDFHGASAGSSNAQTTFVNGATALKADGGQGKVVVWSDSKTDFYGSISADKAGTAEVSSKGTLTYGGQAQLGAGGTLLLDPANIIITDTAGPAAFALIDPNSAADNYFGDSTSLLGTTTNGAFTESGKIVVTSSGDSLGGMSAGAVYLFDTKTGALISSLNGGSANDSVGNNGITALANGNYLVKSGNWDGQKGAVTFGSGTTGVSGAVSAANSLVGSTAGTPFNYYGSTYYYGGDQVGSNGITELANGNYVVNSPNWSMNKGAVTFGSGATGVAGVVSSTNSLVGAMQGQINTPLNPSSTTIYYSFNGGDQIGNNGITALANGNYVVSSGDWDSQKGAVTFGSGTTGVSGVVSATNSLVGSTSATSYAFTNSIYSYGGDRVGSYGITELANGNYLVNSPDWGTHRGAVTFGSGTTGVQGVVSASNSLVGATAGTVNSVDYSFYVNLGYPGPYLQYYISGGDQVGNNGVTALANGNYVVASSSFASNAGQVLIGTPGDISFATGAAAGSTMSFNPSGISATLAGGTAVTLQASNDITVNANINVAGSAGGAFTLQAGRNINLNSTITTANGNFTAVAGDPGAIAGDRMAGTPAITLGAGAAINAGTGVVTLAAVDGNFVNNSGSATPLTAARYLVYSTNPTLGSQGGLTAANVGNAQSYTGATPAYAGTGNWFFYSGTPADISAVVAPLPVGISAVVAPVPAALMAAYASALDDAEKKDRKPRTAQTLEEFKVSTGTSLAKVVSCGVLMPKDGTVGACE